VQHRCLWRKPLKEEVDKNVNFRQGRKFKVRSGESLNNKGIYECLNSSKCRLSNFEPGVMVSPQWVIVRNPISGIEIRRIINQSCRPQK
jgi:hypothetical protein